MLLVALALAVLFVWIVRLTSRISDLESREMESSETVGQLSRKLEELAKAQRVAPAAPASQAAARQDAPPPVVASPPMAAPPVVTPPVVASPPVAARPVVAPPVVAPPPVAVERPSPRAVSVLDVLAGGQEAVEAEPVPVLAATAEPTEPEAKPGFDWEELIGVRLFSWGAGALLALAAVFFLGYSIQQGWLQPPVRMAMGLVTGVGLLVACEMKAARRYATTANALDASAIVILFSTFFAAHSLWFDAGGAPLVGALPAFACLMLVTSVAVLLSIRRDSIFIALLGLVGGFLTPWLLSTGQDNPFGLFGYLLMLNAGLAWIAYRKRWPVLTILSVALTTLYQWGWVGTFLTEGKLPTALGIFLVFPIVGAASLLLSRTDESDAQGRLFSRATSVNATLPLLFALFLSAVPAYGAHQGLLFGFLFCLDVGLFALAVARGPAWLHAAAAGATNMVFLVYLARNAGSDLLPPIGPVLLGFISLFVVFYLASPLLARRLRRPFEDVARHAVLAAPALLFTFPLLIGVEPDVPSPALLFGVLFALVAVVSAFAVVEHVGLVHFVAAFFALAAEAVWSGRYLNDEHLLGGLVIYLAFGLFYIGVPVVARRLGRPLEPSGAGAVVLLVSLVLLFFPAGFLASDAALWGMALLIAILNAAVFVEGASLRQPLLALAGTVVSWLVIAVWWLGAGASSVVGPGLVVVGGFTMLTLAGHIWSARHAGDGSVLSRRGAYGGLVGHLFVCFVALQPGLSVPPWPMLAVLGVLDLAVATAALYTQQAELFLSAVVASAVILIVWLGHANIVPWPGVAITGMSIVAGLALAWMWLARKVRADEAFAAGIDLTAAVAAMLVLVVGADAAGQPGAPGVGVLALALAAWLAILLAVAAFRGWHIVAPLAVWPAATAVAVWERAHPGAEYWLAQLALAGAIYAVFLAYPPALGKRLGRAREPHLAAVLFSAVFFFAARHAMIVAGHENVIAILPVGQALLLALLLVDLLRREPPDSRVLGRLALVAGASLAFVTVAIPLQLEKEWITVGWALEGVALAWLYRRIPHRGLLLASVGLLAAVFVRLALNPEVLVYEPRGAIRIWNWYLYTYLISACAMLSATRLLAGTDDAVVPDSAGSVRARPLLAGAGVVLLFLLLNIEIADFYSTGVTITFNLTATLAQDMTYTLGWALFAVGLLVAGIVIRNKPARMAALVLLMATVVKGFLHDLARLGGLYRVASFVGLAVCLALVAVVLQKFVLAPHPGEDHDTVD